jgi:uncharacterized protein YktA (UPF0223 family)
MLLLAGLAGLLAAPVAARAETPTSTDRQNASQECRYERGTSAATREAFTAKYRNFGKCVSARARDERSERSSAEADAPSASRAERDQDQAAFQQKYGTNKNGKNAFGKCVSAKAHELQQQADERDHAAAAARKSAAKTCAAERKADRSAFRAKYRNFGKCVSKKDRS